MQINKITTNTILNLPGRNQSLRDRSYTTLIRPILEYAKAMCNTHTQTRIKQMDKIQSKAARFTIDNYSRLIRECDTYPTGDMFCEILCSTKP